MVTLITRAQIGLRAPEGRRYLVASKVENVAIHWPGSAKIIDARGDAGLARVKSALRGWQAYHMDDRGWSDIAYQVAVDNQGRAYDLRGVAVQSAANGDQDVNVRFGAILWILGPGEQPSAAMIATTKAVLDMFRAKFPRVPDRPTWHGKIRPGGGTDCPGPAARAAISAGKVDGSPTTTPTKPTTPPPVIIPTDELDDIMALYKTAAEFEAGMARAVYQGNYDYWRAFFKDGAGTGDAIFDGMRAFFAAEAANDASSNQLLKQIADNTAGAPKA